MGDKVYTVFWNNTLTGESGEGEGGVSYQDAKSWADEMNKKHPHIVHSVARSKYEPFLDEEGNRTDKATPSAT